MAFAIMPDRDIEPRIEAALHDLVGATVLTHRSGRPWVLGDEQFVHTRGRNVDVVMVGSQLKSDEPLSSVVKQDRLDGLAALARRFVEFDTLLIGRDGTKTRIYAPVSQRRSVFWTRIDGIVLAADSQYPLAALNQFELDLGTLAGRLANSEVTHPFMRRPIWRNVHALGFGEQVTIHDDGRTASSRWWMPPSPTEDLDSTGPELKIAMLQALMLRVGDQDRVSADLSGGLDSTTLCFALAELGVDLTTFYMSSANDLNNDSKWSDRAATEIASRHVRVPYLQMLEEIEEAVPATVSSFPEGPSAMAKTAASAIPLQRILGASGSRLHLNGHAGDALFGQVSSLPWSFLRTSARRRFRWLRKYRKVNRIPAIDMLRMLGARSTFADELRSMARGEFTKQRGSLAGYADWLEIPNFGPMYTATARQRFSSLCLTELESGVTSLSPDRTQHQILSYLSVHGAVVRRMNSLSPQIVFDSPYLDRRVIDVALSLNHADRTRQSPTKPLLAAGRPPAMSIEYFFRRDKGDYTAEVFSQHQQIKSSVKDLFGGGSFLGELGLVEDREVIRVANSYSPDGAAYTDILDLEFAERWLRSLADEKAKIAVGSLQ